MSNDDGMSVSRIVILCFVGMILGEAFLFLLASSAPWQFKALGWVGVGLMILAGAIEVVAKRVRR